MVAQIHFIEESQLFATFSSMNFKLSKQWCISPSIFILITSDKVRLGLKCLFKEETKVWAGNYYFKERIISVDFVFSGKIASTLFCSASCWLFSLSQYIKYHCSDTTASFPSDCIPDIIKNKLMPSDMLLSPFQMIILQKNALYFSIRVWFTTHSWRINLISFIYWIF